MTPQRKSYFKFKLGFTLFWSFFFILFCYLGIWQLHRYHYKKTLLSAYQLRLNAPATAFIPQPQEFQHVQIKGHYQAQWTFILDNKFYRDQLGYEVLTAFKLNGNKPLLLIDRGWIAKDKLSQVSSIKGTQELSGHIKFMNEYQFILGDNILSATTPILLQKITFSDIEKVTGEKFYPFILRLDKDKPTGFTRDWTISVMPPERHLGYAIQWFCMALTLLIAYGYFCREKD